MNWKEIKNKAATDEEFKFEVLGPLINKIID